MTPFRAQEFRRFCDGVYWTTDRSENPGAVPRADGSAVFCQTDHVFELFRILRRRTSRYVVVTHESDHLLSPRHAHARPWNVVSWLGVNRTTLDPDCHLLPLGLANDSCGLTPKPAHFERIFPPPGGRPGWLYVNHREETNPAVRGGLKEHFRRFVGGGWVRVDEAPLSGGLEGFVESLGSHRFVLCPPGNGPDTHRMWETLCAGAFPVVLRNPVTESFSRLLPLALIDDFRLVTREWLDAEFTRLSAAPLDLSATRLEYWTGLLETARLEARRVSRGRLLLRWIRRKLEPPGA